MFHHLVELPSSFIQFIRTPLLGNPSLAHHDHHVAVSDCMKTVRDQDLGQTPQVRVESLVHKLVCLHVDVGSGLVHQKNLVPCRQCSGQTQQLLFPSRQHFFFALEFCVQSFFQLLKQKRTLLILSAKPHLLADSRSCSYVRAKLGSMFSLMEPLKMNGVCGMTDMWLRSEVNPIFRAS